MTRHSDLMSLSLTDTMFSAALTVIKHHTLIVLYPPSLKQSDSQLLLVNKEQLFSDSGGSRIPQMLGPNSKLYCSVQSNDGNLVSETVVLLFLPFTEEELNFNSEYLQCIVIMLDISQK